MASLISALVSSVSSVISAPRHCTCYLRCTTRIAALKRQATKLCPSVGLYAPPSKSLFCIRAQTAGLFYPGTILALVGGITADTGGYATCISGQSEGQPVVISSSCISINPGTATNSVYVVELEQWHRRRGQKLLYSTAITKDGRVLDCTVL